MSTETPRDGRGSDAAEVPVDDPEVLRCILANTDAPLLDFDGPICGVFAGVGAHNVAAQLRTVLADGGHTDLPQAIAETRDPFDVFRYAATLGHDEATYVEAAFTAHEVEAITTATPTPGAHELITTWHQTGRPLAIVSNNSKEAVDSYLSYHDLSTQVSTVVAREGTDPSKLKPAPTLVQLAIERMSVKSKKLVMIGDSLTDWEAASSVDVSFIGFANRSEKVKLMARRSPTSLVCSIGILKEAAAVFL